MDAPDEAGAEAVLQDDGRPEVPQLGVPWAGGGDGGPMGGDFMIEEKGKELKGVHSRHVRKVILKDVRTKALSKYASATRGRGPHRSL